MKLSQKPAFRWTMLPISILLGFIIAFPLSFIFNQLLHAILWAFGAYMPGKVFLAVALGFDGAIAAACVIFSAAFTAPAYRVQVAAIALLIGALVAWSQVGYFYSPIHSSNEPQRLWWPIGGTYIGGLLSLLIIWRNHSKSTVA